ncbi:hypothetical protein DAEQUDRAFT_655322, partial [Daedalea quercina L-15889]
EGMEEIKWLSGVEEYQDVNMDTLWAYIGRQKEWSIPFFNTKEAVTGTFNPWFEDSIKAMVHDNTIPLTLCWHQLVSIIKMVDNILHGHPTLLMDSVGIGKTMQVIGLICILAYFHEYYDKHHQFPSKY